MSLPVVYLPEAEDDVAAAHASYEQHRTALGDQFLEAVREAVSLFFSSFLGPIP